jgi:hypothetical protein
MRLEPAWLLKRQAVSRGRWGACLPSIIGVFGLWSGWLSRCQFIFFMGLWALWALRVAAGAVISVVSSVRSGCIMAVVVVFGRGDNESVGKTGGTAALGRARRKRPRSKPCRKPQ